MANTILHWSRISSFWSKTPRLEKTHAFINDFDHIPWEDTPDFPNKHKERHFFRFQGPFGIFQGGPCTFDLELYHWKGRFFGHHRYGIPGAAFDQAVDTITMVPGEGAVPNRNRVSPLVEVPGPSMRRWEKNKLQMDRWIFRSPRETPVVAVRKWGQITHLRNIIGITNFCTFFSNGNLDRTKKQLIFPGLGIGLLTISCFSCWYPIYAMCPLQVSTNNYPFQQISAYFLIVHWFCNMFTLTPFGMIQFEEHVFPYWNHSIFCVCVCSEWLVCGLPRGSFLFGSWFLGKTTKNLLPPFVLANISFWLYTLFTPLG